MNCDMTLRCTILTVSVCFSVVVELALRVSQVAGDNERATAESEMDTILR